MSYQVRNAKRIPADTFEHRHTVERGEVFQHDLATGGFSTVSVLQAYCEANSIECDYCTHYGEPGYNAEKGVLFSNWNNVPKTLAKRLESQGYELEWSDEWYVDYNNDKAYRTQGDSYGWQSSIMYSEASGDYLTPDDDVSDWIAACENETRLALPGWIDSTDIEAAGYVRTSDTYENGFHPGQNDDPAKIGKALKAAGKDYVFQIADVGQFDVSFRVWIKQEDSDHA